MYTYYMEKAIPIRKATRKDLKSILRLNSLLFNKEYREYDKTLNTRWPKTKKAQKYFLSRINTSSGFVRVAEAKGRIVGYFCGGIIKPRSYQKHAIFAELENTLIETAYRSKGIGSSFMRQFLEWCKEKQVRYLLVEASAENNRAIDFYRSHGFSDLNLTLLKKM